MEKGLKIKIQPSNDGKRFYIEIKDIIRFIDYSLSIQHKSVDKLCKDAINEMLDYTPDVDVRAVRKKGEFMKEIAASLCDTMKESLKASRKDFKKYMREERANG